MAFSISRNTANRDPQSSTTNETPISSNRPLGVLWPEWPSLATDPVPEDFPVYFNDIPNRIHRFEYAVRGEIPTLAGEIERRMLQGKKYPFKKLVWLNIGNPQFCGQQPVSYFRDLVAGMMSTKDVDHGEEINEIVERWHAELTGGLGAYSHSKGALVFRKQAAQWFHARDGFACDTESVYLTNGASGGAVAILDMMLNKGDGCLVPIPQYPLYSATIERINGRFVGYELVEEDEWRLDVDALETCINAARSDGIPVKVLVVINPGNPTGSVLTEKNLQDVIRLCEREKIVILADEVYQDNIFNEDVPFIPMRRLLLEMKSECPLFSLHSGSKGFMGECGFRSGVLQTENVPEVFTRLLVKYFSVNLCSNVPGQCMMAAILSHPRPDSEEYEQFIAEKTKILDDLTRKAQLAHARLNQMEGVVCQRINGAMYAFPKFEFTDRFIEEAKANGRKPDVWYCYKLLNNCGIVTVPGSGFGQEEGTHHLRLSLLPAVAEFEDAFDRWAIFHSEVMNETPKIKECDKCV
ncbi:MAG: hypothetical protein KVP17_004518 [Porospora cf. gigantea B]|uniref:uncharacterized protein n=1 Tax=Porospora cf. gigantea B TaxID=2853592 RepID=UPI003571FA1D|nr:MAG: hypothetical protein KVP17_004518 [Porospora cf. gigantea B]